MICFAGHDIKIGDYVEFESDRQIEQGPCTKRVIDAHKLSIFLEADRPGEEISVDRSMLIVNKRSTHHRDGRPLFICP